MSTNSVFSCLASKPKAREHQKNELYQYLVLVLLGLLDEGRPEQRYPVDTEAAGGDLGRKDGPRPWPKVWPSGGGPMRGTSRRRTTTS